MTIEDINTWIIERDKTLETRNVGALITFMDKWSKKGIYSIRDCDNIKKAKPQEQIKTLCKMICNVPTLSKDTKIWAIKQLKDLGGSNDKRRI